MCREKESLPPALRIFSGSPLRVQGKDVNQQVTHRKDRITPACAGKSDGVIRKLREIQDHPCVCREKNPKTYFIETNLGSPLRVQGKAKCNSHGCA